MTRGDSNAMNGPPGGESLDRPHPGLPPHPPPPPHHHDAFGRISRDPGPPPYPPSSRRGSGGPRGGGPPFHPNDHRGSNRDHPPAPPRGYDYRRGPDGGHWEGRGRGGHPPPSGGRRGRRDYNRSRSPNNSSTNQTSSSHNGTITFRSFEEERDWVEDRRRKRRDRPSKFDVPPTAQQLAVDQAQMALSNPAATDFAGIPAGRDFAAVPQQTRHARRLYIGHLPPNVTEAELHSFFRQAIEQALVAKPTDDEDPILSVYINHERRFCFLEFRTVEMATACLALDGINIHGKGKVKVKRPNDYNPAMAPKVHPSAIPQLDVSKLGIISGTVEDGPNKVFIGGLHYHLTEDQVLELLQAFGKVKAFHLVKNEPDSLTSKGYCFVEYADPSVTPVAVIGLNGMDLGGGKQLTARVAGERTATMATAAAVPATASMMWAATSQLPGVGGEATAKPGSVIVSGYEIDELVDAAMGLKAMPTAPKHVDQFGVPITRVPTVPIIPQVVQKTNVAAALPQLNSTATAPGVPTRTLPPGPSALDIANAALDAAFGPGTSSAPAITTATNPVAVPPQKTRILVLLNMVSDEDLETDEEYNGLKDEVGEEVAKFGKLISMKIPRRRSPSVGASAIRKIFLEYATVQDAANAERELAGRQFGSRVVEASYYSEVDYREGKLQ